MSCVPREARLGGDRRPQRAGPDAAPARAAAELHAGRAGGRWHRGRAPGPRLRRRRRRPARPHGRPGVQRRPGPRPGALRAGAATRSSARTSTPTARATSSRCSPARASATCPCSASATGCRPSTSPAAARCASTCRTSPCSRICQDHDPFVPAHPVTVARGRCCTASPARPRSRQLLPPPGRRPRRHRPRGLRGGARRHHRGPLGPGRPLPARRPVAPEVLTHRPEQAALFTALSPPRRAPPPSPWRPEVGSGPAR